MSCHFPKSRCKLDCWFGDWWYSLHRRQVEKIINNQAEAIILGDSLVAGLSRYPDIWDLFKPHNVINCGIKGDRIENVLWRVDHLYLPDSVKCAIISCGTNNMDDDTPLDISSSLVSLAMELRIQNPQLHVCITGILPRDQFVSPRREKIRKTNVLLEASCLKNPNLTYIEVSDSWTNDSGQLDETLFLKIFCISSNLVMKYLPGNWPQLSHRHLKESPKY